MTCTPPCNPTKFTDTNGYIWLYCTNCKYVDLYQDQPMSAGDHIRGLVQLFNHIDAEQTDMALYVPVTNKCPGDSVYGQHLAVYDGEGLICAACSVPVTLDCP